jgi:hypothetical protein
MRILLDECLPRKLRLLLVGHEAVTVAQAGWSGIKNGKLLGLAQEGFDVFSTIDQNLAAQQNLSQFKVAVVILESTSNELEQLIPLVPRLLELLSKSISGLHRISA